MRKTRSSFPAELSAPDVGAQVRARLCIVGRFAIAAMLACVLAVAASGCESDETASSSYTVLVSNDNITIGYTYSDYANIIDMAADQLDERGITYDLIQFDDVTAALDAVENEEIDAAFCTSLPYVSLYNDDNDTDLTTKGAVVASKMGLYSLTVQNLDDLPDGASIAISSDELGLSRALHMLEDLELITLDEDAEALKATLSDVVENPKNLNLKPTDEADLVEALSSNAAVAIPFYPAIAAGLDINSALGAESDKSASAWEYADIVVVRSDEESVDKFDKLIGALRDVNIGDSLEARYGDAVIDIMKATWGNV